MVLLSVYAARPEFATKGGVTRINVNALFMLSFPAVDLTYNTNIWHHTECYHSRVEVIAELFKIKRDNDVDG